jgi:hypothetical protein
MITLADLRARNVAPTWQEAVAVVQELLQTAVGSSGSASRLPDIEHVALIPNGDVVALPGSPAVAEPVRHLGAMLDALLKGGAAPGELIAVVERAVSAPPQFAGVDEFSKALAFFERPGRRGDVERLVSRAMTAEAQSRADEELRRLKERAAAAERAPLDETLAIAPARRRSRLPLAVAVVVVLVLFGIAAAVWYRADRARVAREAEAAAKSAATRILAATEGQPTPLEHAEAQAPGVPSAAAPAPPVAQPQPSLVARAAEAVRSAVGSLLGTREEPKTPEPAPVAEVVPAKPKPRPRTKPSAPPAVPVPPPPEVAPVASPTIGPAPAVVPSIAPGPAPVYTSADADVVPPVLVRPMLPANPPPTVPPDQVGTLDLVIDESGNVEQVKLSSPANRYQERMLVSHVKSWKFKPATRDGLRVKYRTRVRVTI